MVSRMRGEAAVEQPVRDRHVALAAAAQHGAAAALEPGGGHREAGRVGISGRLLLLPPLWARSPALARTSSPPTPIVTYCFTDVPHIIRCGMRISDGLPLLTVV